MKNLKFFQFKFFPLFLVCLSSFMSFATAMEIRHSLAPRSNFASLTSQNVCSTHYNSFMSYACNPALSAYVLKSNVSIQTIFKASGDSIDKGQKFLFERLNQDYLKKMLDSNGAISFTGNLNFDFINPYFIFSYTPYYFLFDFYIKNPLITEVSLFLLKRSTLSLQSGVNLTPHRDYDLDVGASISLINDQNLNKTFNIFDLSVEGLNRIMTYERHHEINGSFGTFFRHKTMKFLPLLSFQVKNINSSYNKGSKYHYLVNNPNAYELKHALETYSSLGMGYLYHLPYGKLHFGIENNFTYLPSAKNYTYSAIAWNYMIGPISFAQSYSYRAWTLGTFIQSDPLSVGIVYTDSKEFDDHYIPRERSFYTGMELKF